MTGNDFEVLKDYILRKNEYFSYGFANAFKFDATHGSEVKGSIFVNDNEDFVPIFPDDTLSNYFYIRNESSAKFQLKQGYEECGVGRFNFDDIITCNLVAFVDDGDAYELISALRNTLLSFGGLNVIPTAATWQRESVMMNEMSGMGEEDIVKALQNIKRDTAIVNITLQVSKEYVPSNCVINPCKTCS